MRYPITRRLATTLLVPALFALPAVAAQSDFSPSLGEMPSYAVTASGDPIHSGGLTAADTALAMDVANALASDSRLDGATITVSANNGGISLSGSAESSEQAHFAEQRAREVAGVRNVSGTLSPVMG